MKQSFFLVPMLIMLGFLLVFPETAFSCAASGLMLWFHTLLPALLPFIILSNLLIKTNLLKKWIELPKKIWARVFALSPEGAYALLMGILCGYPMGAKVTADLYREKRISKNEAEYLLTFSNYPGPSFLSSYVCLHTLNRRELILPTYFIIYLSGYLCSLLFRKKTGADPHTFTSSASCKTKKVSSSLPLGELLDTSIMNGFESITKLGGYIILFSVVQGIIQKVFAQSSTLMYLLCGFTEMSTGITVLANTGWPLSILYPLITGITASGGMCIAAQTKSMLAETDLSAVPYIAAKICCFFISFFLAFLFIKIAV